MDETHGGSTINATPSPTAIYHGHGLIAPLFIVNNVPAALAFYRDRLGFDITFQGPEPDDIFFGIVRRGAARIMFKDVGIDPVPNYTRDVKKGIAPWDAYLHVSDPDALAAEFSSRDVEFSEPLKDTDAVRGQRRSRRKSAAARFALNLQFSLIGFRIFTSSKKDYGPLSEGVCLRVHP